MCWFPVPVKATLIDDIPHDESGVSGARRESVALFVERQARHGTLVTVKGHSILIAGVAAKNTYTPIPKTEFLIGLQTLNGIYSV